MTTTEKAEFIPNCVFIPATAIWKDSRGEHVDADDATLLMLDGTKLIGEATLHQRHGGWKRHIGLVTVLTHPDYHGRDVAKILVEEIIGIARHLGLQRLEARFNGERKVALRALAMLGFRELLREPDYVLDMQSRPHEYVLLGMDLRAAEEYAGTD